MIWKSKDYYFERLVEADLEELLRFYVLEIYRHYHFTEYTEQTMQSEVNHLLKEDKLYFKNSVYYVLRSNNNQQIFGAIRLTYWDKKMDLPIEKLFGIELSSLLLPGVDNFWHIGRFVISSGISGDRISFLKKTLFNAFYPVYKMKFGLIIAECDLKVSNTLNRMGIDTCILGKPKEYICSETVPLYIRSDWLQDFILYNNHRYLSKENVKDIAFFRRLGNRNNAAVNINYNI